MQRARSVNGNNNYNSSSFATVLLCARCSAVAESRNIYYEALEDHPGVSDNRASAQSS